MVTSRTTRITVDFALTCAISLRDATQTRECNDVDLVRRGLGTPVASASIHSNRRPAARTHDSGLAGPYVAVARATGQT